ncbi:hypothetical protein ONZ45_g16068 [Pleurotus djamor]|nr:hypothetical protein ONZ45_g16068 [Pleurotus djamor]
MSLSATNREVDSPLTPQANDRVDLLHMKLIIESMLHKCGVKAHRLPMNAEFSQKCLNDAISLGVSLEASPSYLKANEAGSAMAYFAFSHLKSEATRVFIGTYTALIIHIEDKTDILEALAKQLRMLHEHFGHMQANGIVTATVKCMTSLWHEPKVPHERRDTDTTLDCCCGFPRYVRGMSGTGEAFAMFIFPREVEFSVYAQAIPSLTGIVGYLNDVLSLHKEELAGEDTNFITTMAKHHDTTKSQIFLKLSDQVVRWFDISHRILDVRLSGSAEAFGAFMSFMQGYVDYHTSAARYRLDEVL